MSWQRKHWQLEHLPRAPLGKSSGAGAHKDRRRESRVNARASVRRELREGGRS